MKNLPMPPTVEVPAVEVHGLPIRPGQSMSVFLHATMHCNACGTNHPSKTVVQVQLSVDDEGIPRVCIPAKHKGLVTTFEDAYPEQYTSRDVAAATALASEGQKL